MVPAAVVGAVEAAPRAGPVAAGEAPPLPSISTTRPRISRTAVSRRALGARAARAEMVEAVELGGRVPRERPPRYRKAGTGAQEAPADTGVAGPVVQAG